MFVIHKSIRFAMLSIAFSFILFIFACTKSPSTKAQEFIDVGMYEQAKTVLSSGIESDPKNAKLHFMLGQCLLKTNDIEQAQESFDRAAQLDSNYGKLIGNVYYSQAVAATKSNNRGYLFQLAAKYDPSTKTAIAKIYMDAVIRRLDDQIDILEQISKIAVSYDPTVGKQIAAALLKKASDNISDIKTFPHLNELSILATQLDSSSNSDWANLFYKRLTSTQAEKDPKTSFAIGDAVIAYDPSLKKDIAHYYMETAKTGLLANPLNATTASIFFSHAMMLDQTLKSQIAELVWNRLNDGLSNLKVLGQINFNNLFTLCDESGLSESIRNSVQYKFSQALKLWVDGRHTSAIEQMETIASSGGNSLMVNLAQQILSPPAMGKRTVQSKPIHFNTWSFGPGRGNGVDIQLISYEVQADNISLTFSVKSGDHKDLLLYAPQNRKERFEPESEELYTLDDNGKKFYSISGGWSGGRQEKFNSSTIKINFDPNEEVILTSSFPMVSKGATSIKFVSPNPDNAGHQDEWSWPDIRLKKGPFD